MSLHKYNTCLCIDNITIMNCCDNLVSTAQGVVATPPEPRPAGPTAASRRHTMAGTKPTRPRPPPISPQAHESHEVPSSKRPKTTPAAPPTQPHPPPSFSVDEKALYSSVKKPKRYPAPTMPAPPPPYEGDALKKVTTNDLLITPTPAPPSAAKMSMKEEQSLKPHPPDETDGSSTSTDDTGGSGPTGIGRPRPPRPAPSRPSRPPAGKRIVCLMIDLGLKA